MKRNMGNLDRIIRVVVAALFAYLFFSGTVSGVLGIVLLVLGAVFLLTSTVAVCPLYMPFKVSTLKYKDENNDLINDTKLLSGYA